MSEPWECRGHISECPEGGLQGDAWGPSGGPWGPKIMEGVALALEVKTWKLGSQRSDSGDV